MRIIHSSIMAAAVLAAAVFMGYTSLAGDNKEQRVTEHLVEIRNLEFMPKSIEVKPGDKITWINYDLVPHTVTADDESWDSGLINSNDKWETEVKEDMYASYFCRYHPTMKARLDVLLK